MYSFCEGLSVTHQQDVCQPISHQPNRYKSPTINKQQIIKAEDLSYISQKKPEDT